VTSTSHHWVGRKRLARAYSGDMVEKRGAWNLHWKFSKKDEEIWKTAKGKNGNDALLCARMFLEELCRATNLDGRIQYARMLLGDAFHDLSSKEKPKLLQRIIHAMERSEKIKEFFRSNDAQLRILDLLYENMKIPHTHHDEPRSSVLTSKHAKNSSMPSLDNAYLERSSAVFSSSVSDDGAETKKHSERVMVTTAGCLVKLLSVLMTHDTNVNDLKAVLSFVSGKWPMPVLGCDGEKNATVGASMACERGDSRAYHSPHFCELCRSMVLKMLLQVARVEENDSRFGRFVLWGHNAGLKVPTSVKWPKWGMSFFF